MATSLATFGLQHNWSMPSVVATTLFGIAAATALLGVSLVLIGKLKLASLVSYLPAPVVGGYLAFIGLFCFDAGLNICTNVVFTGMIQTDLQAFRKVFTTKEHILHVVPGLIGGAIFLWVSYKSKHIFALPGTIVGMLALFYGTLLVTNTSFEAARENGWLDPLPTGPAEPFWTEFEFFDFSLIEYKQLLPLIPTWVGMTFVVAFSSCLDVSAIEMDMGRPLKIDHELVTVGWSNVISGICGGYTGSYIFSQTIFTYRANLDSRICGVVVIFAEIALVIVPVPLMSYVPKFFFAATLMFIAFDLMIEWILDSRKKMLWKEYLVLLSTFVLINVYGLEEGMCFAMVFAMVNFVFAYSQTTKMIVSKIKKTSNILTYHDERQKIIQAHREICALQLHGYLFFGSAVNLVKEVKKTILVNQKRMRSSSVIKKADFLSIAEAAIAERQSAIDMSTPSLLSPMGGAKPNFASLVGRKEPAATNGSGDSGYFRLNSKSPGSNAVLSLFDLERQGGAEGFRSPRAEEKHNALRNPLSNRVKNCDIEREMLPTRFVVLDFQRVTGIDTTAVRTCFLVLDKLCETYGIAIIASGCTVDITFLLNSNGLQRWEPGRFPTLEKALLHAEETVTGISEHIEKFKSPKLRSKYDRSKSSHDGRLLTAILRMARSQHRVDELQAGVLSGIERWFEVSQKLALNDSVFHAGETSEKMYVVESGEITLSLPDSTDSEDEIIVRKGFVFGEADFFLNQARTNHAVARVHDTVLWSLSQSKFEEMSSVEPGLTALFEKIMLRIMSRQVSYSRNFG
jgi:MFS superfamily sulfate permease-like transporter/CRP-like cAMP-binding protein